MVQSFASVGIYLVSTLFTLYIMTILLRFLLQTCRADFYNPISQTIVKITDPGLRPLRRIIPGLGGIDLSSLALALIVQSIAICLIILLLGGQLPNILSILSWSVVGILSLLLNIYFFALIIVIILSWVAPNSYNPAAVLIHQLTEPLMRRARKIIPPIGGLDISPIFIFIAINILKILVIENLAVILHLPRGLIPWV
jgi:YggT family protein